MAPVEPRHLFNDLPRPSRRAFLAASRAVHLRAKEVLFHAGDEGASCYYLRSGVAKATVFARGGQERLLAVLGPGNLIGELSLFDDGPRSATVTALRPCRLVHLSKAAFFQIADRDPNIYRGVLHIMTQRLRESNDALVSQGSATMVGRVARAFWSLAYALGDSRGPRITLTQRMSQTDIAAMAGVARENANRAISELISEGVISRRDGLYVIEDMNNLMWLAEV